MQRSDKHDHADAEVVLWIDTYNDLFSDFDPRPFGERMVSEDFVTQVKRVVKEKPHSVHVLKLLVPGKMRQQEEEGVIRKRLNAYFTTQHKQSASANRTMRRKGFYFSTAGLIFMLTATYLKELKIAEFYMTFLLTLFEPGGWFLLWTGLDFFMSYSKNRILDVAFFHRMANAHVDFDSY